MISTPDRRQTIALIDQAVAQGASQHKACEVLGISPRTYQRWTHDGGIKTDGRPGADRPAPANRLSEAERASPASSESGDRWAQDLSLLVMPMKDALWWKYLPRMQTVERFS